MGRANELAEHITYLERCRLKIKGWIAQAYPGTKLAYDEWNRGTGKGTADALATIDGLGVYGVQGVDLDLASFFGLTAPTDPSAYALLMMRDYDGHGSAFGDTSVSATTADASKLTIYGAQRTADGAATIVVVNQSASALTSALKLANIDASQPVRVYTYSAANATAIVAGASLAPATTLYPTFAGNSITLLVVPSGSTPLSAARRVR